MRVLILLLALLLPACGINPPKAPQGIIEQIEAVELTAQQLSASVTKLTCTRFVAKQCVEPGKAFSPDQGLVFHDTIQKARGALKATAAISDGQIGECLGQQRSQASCLAAAQAILAEIERKVLEEQAKGVQK